MHYLSKPALIPTDLSAEEKSDCGIQLMDHVIASAAFSRKYDAATPEKSLICAVRVTDQKSVQ